MKKLILLFVLVAFSVTQLVAQKSTFEKGDKVLNLGLGLGSTLGYAGYGGLFGYKTTVPPLSAAFEVCIVDKIAKKGSVGVGGFIGYSSAKSTYSSGGWKYSDLIFGVRGAFHWPLVDKLDTYAGVSIGYDIRGDKPWGTATGESSITGSHLLSEEFVGARYYFTDNFAVMGELGYGIAVLKIGVALKF